MSDLEAHSNVDNPYGFEVGSMVEVPMAQERPRYGVIRWIGTLSAVKGKLVAGLELVRTTVLCFIAVMTLNESLFVIDHCSLRLGFKMTCLNYLSRYMWPLVFVNCHSESVVVKVAFATDGNNFWLSLSVKQRQIPCSGSHLCTRIWVCAMIGLLKMPLSIANQDEGKFEVHFQYFIHSIGGPEQGYQLCFTDITNQC